MDTQKPNICNYVNMAIMDEICRVDKQLNIDDHDNNCYVDHYQNSRDVISGLRNHYPECHDEQVDQRLDNILAGLDGIIEANQDTTGACKNWHVFAASEDHLHSYIDTIMIGEDFYSAIGKGRRFGTGGVEEGD